MRTPNDTGTPALSHDTANHWFGTSHVQTSKYNGGELTKVELSIGTQHADIGEDVVELFDTMNGNKVTVSVSFLQEVCRTWDRMWGERFAPYSAPGEPNEDNRYEEECVGL